MLELQRLLTTSPASLPRRLIVDVGGILRHVQETAPQSWPIPQLIEVSQRARRDILWVVAAPSVPGLVTPEMLSRAAMDLEEAGVTRLALSATESLAAILARNPPARAVAIVTAGIDERTYELHVLDMNIVAVLDAASGVVWTYEKARAAHGEPRLLPELAAVVGAEPGEAAAGGPAAVRARGRVLAHIDGSEASSLPAGVVLAVGRRHLRAAELRGGKGTLDSGEDEVARWLARGHGGGTVYVTARAGRDSDGTFLFNEIGIDIGGRVQHASGEVAATALLRATVAAHPKRWFASRGLDLLAAMVDANIPLPAAMVDPAIVAFALRPGETIDLTLAAPTAAALPTGVRAWLTDATRAIPPPKTIDFLLDVLPDIDADLEKTVQDEGMSDLVEKDLALTLPILARIERAGAWAGMPEGCASWTELRVHFEGEAAEAEAFAHRQGVNDVYRDGLDELYEAVSLKHVNAIPRAFWHPSLSSEQRLARLRNVGVPQAIAIQRARRLGLKLIPRVRSIERLAGGRVRGVSSPQSAGRWALRDVALQNIPKRMAEGKWIRSGLRGPPGLVLVGADYNGFEVRLLADLSNDAELLDASEADDVHAAIAARITAVASVSVGRTQAKDVVLAIMYGQGKEGFWRARADIPIADAEKLYAETQTLLRGVKRWRATVHASLEAQGCLYTRGGWRLLPPTTKKKKEKQRSVFNGLVQGLGADILRWVLRRLAQLLPPEARVVSQAHDEIIIACPLALALHVEELLMKTMTDDVVALSGRIQNGVRLVASPKRGLTWKDMA